MNEITKENIVKRWDKLAQADLGALVSPMAARIRNFFVKMFDHDNGDGWFWCSEFTSSDKVVGILRGFQINEGYGTEDGLTLAFSFDLHSVRMSDEMLEDFDCYLMQSKPYSAAENNWLWYWQGLMRSEMKPTKKRRSRKTA